MTTTTGRIIHRHSAEKSMNEIDQERQNAWILASYFYFPRRNQLIDIHNQFKDKEVHLMIDSGVFSFRKMMAKQGRENEELNIIDKYIEFLNANVDLITYALTLDYPHDAATIIKNTDYIQERLDPRIHLVPVIQSFIFTPEQSEYFIKNWDFICVGTYDGVHKNIMYNDEVEETLKPIYKINEKYNKVLHGLGRTKTHWLKKCKMSSSDSSAWARYVITGNTALWDFQKKKTVHFSKENRTSMYDYERYYLSRFDIKPEDYSRIIRNPKVLYADTYPHDALCCLAYLLMQEEVRKSNPDFRTFFATSNGKNFAALNKAADLYYNRKK